MEAMMLVLLFVILVLLIVGLAIVLDRARDLRELVEAQLINTKRLSDALVLFLKAARIVPKEEPE